MSVRDDGGTARQGRGSDRPRVVRESTLDWVKFDWELSRDGNVPPVEKALRFLASEGEPHDAAQARGRRAIVGAPDKVRAQVEQLAADYGADEVIVVTITHEHAARRRSYELLADAFDLPRADAAAAPAGLPV